MQHQKSDFRILLVDDDQGVLGAICQTLKVRGYTGTTPFDAGAPALKWMETEHFDLLVTDLEMPGLNGRELLRAALQKSPDAQVIVFSGLMDEYLERDLLGAGARACLRKPFRISRLLEEVEGVFNQPAARMGGQCGASLDDKAVKA